MTANPYESPRGETPGSLLVTDKRLTLFSATMYVLLIAGGGALLGSIFGLLIGLVSPDYYRAIFREADADDFIAVLMGVVLGGTQGFFGGAGIGFIILMIYVWYLTRVNRRAADS